MILVHYFTDETEDFQYPKCGHQIHGFYDQFRYIEESILKTGVAIETQGFNFVTSGKKRDSLKVSNTFSH